MTLTALQPVVTSVINFVMLLFLFYLVQQNRILSLARTHVFLWVIAITAVVVSAECWTLLVDGVPLRAARIANLCANAIGFGCSPFIPVLLAQLHHEALRRNSLVYLPAACTTLLAFSSPFTGLIFSISAENIYARGSVFFVYVLSYLFGFSIFFYALFLEAHRFQKNEQRYLVLLALIVTAGTSLQVAFPHLYSSWHSVTLSLILYYLFQCELQFKYDALTGVLNRAAFQRRLDELGRTDRATILLFDLDEFKGINDQYGHEVGDTCLVTAAEILHRAFSSVGSCYRIGGDEFCVLAAGHHADRVETAVAEMLHRVMDARATMPMMPFISYGCCVYDPADYPSIDAALRAADKRMYHHKFGTKHTAP